MKSSTRDEALSESSRSKLLSSLGLTARAQEQCSLSDTELENLKQFKTADGKQYTGLIDDGRPIVDSFRPEEPL